MEKFVLKAGIIVVSIGVMVLMSPISMAGPIFSLDNDNNPGGPSLPGNNFNHTCEEPFNGAAIQQSLVESSAVAGVQPIQHMDVSRIENHIQKSMNINVLSKNVMPEVDATSVALPQMPQNNIVNTDFGNIQIIEPTAHYIFW